MIIKTSILKNALDLVAAGLAKSGVITSSQNFAFIGNKIVTYNDSFAIYTRVKELDLNGMVEAQKFHSFIKKVKQEDIEIFLEDMKLIVKTTTGKASFDFISEVNLPLDEIIKPSKWDSLPEKFTEYLKFVSPVCSKSDMEPIMSCVHISDSIESSDKYRIANIKLEKNMQKFLLPERTASMLSKYSLEFISIGDNWVHFKTTEKATISCRCLDGVFPDTSRLLDLEGSEVVFPDTLLYTLNIAEVFIDKNNVAIILKNKLDGLRISVDGSNCLFEEILEFDSTEEFEIKINIAYLKYGLNFSNKCILGKTAIKFFDDEKGYLIGLMK